MEQCKVKEPYKLLELGTVQQIEDRIISWLGTLKGSGKATATMKTALACVVFFYSCNRVKVENKYIGRRLPKMLALPHRSPTKAELGGIIEAANLRGEALANTLASTGVRIGAIPELKLRRRRKVKPEELEHHDCRCKDRSRPQRFNGYLLNAYDGEEEQYFAFMSEESSKWLDTYHKMRQNAGEVTGSNRPLFRELFDIERPEIVKNPSLCHDVSCSPFSRA
ncbi:MAG TPA: hypothetical protein VJZ68_07575 [Nitrososphaera sp.]|nr:hypothetical protein [Nitrososphaera sp.]